MNSLSKATPHILASGSSCKHTVWNSLLFSPTEGDIEPHPALIHNTRMSFVKNLCFACLRMTRYL